MTVWLVQHGRALPKHQDPDRPLSGEGRVDVARVATRLVAEDGSGPCGSVRRVVHSGKTRARETAELLAQALSTDGSGPAVEQSDELGPTDDVEPWARRLDGGEYDATVLVGHLPFMEKLAARLLTGEDEPPVVRFTEGGVLCLCREDEEEGDAAGPAEWTVHWFVIPETA